MKEPEVESPLVRVLDRLSQRAYQEVLRDPAAMFNAVAGTARQAAIFGCGHLGGLALSGLVVAGWAVVALVDNNRSLQGCTVNGLPVLAPEEAVKRFNDKAVFVVAIYNGSTPRSQLAALGCRRIVPYPMLFWRFRKHMQEETRLELPQVILGATEQLNEAFRVLNDQKSRDEFAAQIFWRCSLDYSRLPPHDPPSDMYFPSDLVQFKQDEVFMDCGAFDGDSICAFVQRTGQRYRQIIALEPDPRNRAALKRFADEKSIHDLAILPFAMADYSGAGSFEAKGTVGSSLSANDTGISVECRRIDDLAGIGTPTFIKMDIEGSEPDALKGGRLTIRKARPILAACAYHKCEHLWQIPLLMRDILPEYQISLRRYAEECWETVYYAIPPERALGRT